MASYNIILYCAVVFIVSSIGGTEYRYDYPYFEKAGGWMKIHKVPAVFIEAFYRCKAEGALLASPLTLEMGEVMTSLFQQVKSPACGIYTGIQAVFSKGDYASVEGVPLGRIPVVWAPGEPDDEGSTEACTIMLQNSTIANVPCNESFPYICYKKKTETPRLTACGTVDKEYKLEPRTGSCYKFHQIGRNWRQAYMTCMAEGGYLAIINSVLEAKVITEIFARYPISSIASPFKNVAAIGFYATHDYRQWMTIHGETLQEAGYLSFAPSEPNNDKTFDGGSYCGGVYRSGVLDDIWCDSMSFAFICEKKPDSLRSDL